jgi:hypothetical protein
MRKIVLTSMLAICIACPAFAESFPSDGYMKENKTYEGAATYENMGVYENFVNANALYDDCPAGSYCDETGQHLCSELGEEFIYSESGAETPEKCYRPCSEEDIEYVGNASAVAGNFYYGGEGGTAACYPTACLDGYHLEMGDGEDAELNSMCVPNSITIYWDHVAEGAGETYVDYGGDVVTPTKAEVIPGKTFVGWQFFAPEPEEGGSW